MASLPRYVEQVELRRRLVGCKAGHERWSIAYQLLALQWQTHRSLAEPDIGDAIRKTCPPKVPKKSSSRPSAFVCDHVEILYDLDIEASNR